MSLGWSRDGDADPGLGIRPVVEADIPDLARMMARAFADDPWFRYVTPGAADPQARLRVGWTGMLRYASARLVATYTTGSPARSQCTPPVADTGIDCWIMRRPPPPRA